MWTKDLFEKLKQDLAIIQFNLKNNNTVYNSGNRGFHSGSVELPEQLHDYLHRGKGGFKGADVLRWAHFYAQANKENPEVSGIFKDESLAYKEFITLIDKHKLVQGSLEYNCLFSLLSTSRRISSFNDKFCDDHGEQYKADIIQYSVDVLLKMAGLPDVVPETVAHADMIQPAKKDERLPVIPAITKKPLLPRAGSLQDNFSYAV